MRNLLGLLVCLFLTAGCGMGPLAAGLNPGSMNVVVPGNNAHASNDEPPLVDDGTGRLVRGTIPGVETPPPPPPVTYYGVSP